MCRAGRHDAVQLESNHPNNLDALQPNAFGSPASLVRHLAFRPGDGAGLADLLAIPDHIHSDHRCRHFRGSLSRFLPDSVVAATDSPRIFDLRISNSIRGHCRAVGFGVFWIVDTDRGLSAASRLRPAQSQTGNRSISGLPRKSLGKARTVTTQRAILQNVLRQATP